MRLAAAPFSLVYAGTRWWVIPSTSPKAARWLPREWRVGSEESLSIVRAVGLRGNL